MWVSLLTTSIALVRDSLDLGNIFLENVWQSSSTLNIILIN